MNRDYLQYLMECQQDDARVEKGIRDWADAYIKNGFQCRIAAINRKLYPYRTTRLVYLIRSLIRSCKDHGSLATANRYYHSRLYATRADHLYTLFQRNR